VAAAAKHQGGGIQKRGTRAAPRSKQSNHVIWNR
jgi:hypothetical protein